MLDIIFKKKITEQALADYFVTAALRLVDEGFPEVIEVVRLHESFERIPQISNAQPDAFLLIVLAGNYNYITQSFHDYQDVRLIDQLNRKFATALGTTEYDLKASIKAYQTYFKRVNHPSKNTHYAMSKAFFFKYELNDYQEDYFRNMKTPNPILLKQLDELMANFIWDWAQFKEKYRILQG